jgi:F-type H+-transporting ATPase subunit gamma
MAERLTEVQERLASIGELQGLVSATRVLAAARVQQAQATLPALRAHAEVVGDAIAEGLSLIEPDAEPPPRAAARAPRGLVLFCAEHGFAGAFSRRILDAALLGDRPAPSLFVIGSRGSVAALEARLQPVWTLPMATQVGAVTETARRIAEELYRRFSAGSLVAVEMLFARYRAGGHSMVTRQALLPVDLASFRAPLRRRSPPVVNLDPQRLLERLAEEYFFAQLARAAMESFASENGARLAAMQSARENVDRTLGELRAAERGLRQEQITGEILEIVTGAETAQSGTQEKSEHLIRPAGHSP